tara:strand:- start:981 stop:1631 length:651 start_codon:yes stop_codon:yes gene_type:complete
MNNILFLDFETTGLNPYLNDVIEIAIKKYGSDDYYQTLVKPRRLPKGLVTYVPPHITNLTHITDQMIYEDSITKENAVYNMFQYIETICNKDGPIYLVSHNGTVFDFIIFRKLYEEYCNKTKFTRFKNNLMNRIQYIDTVLLAKLFMTDKERVSQSRLCSKYNITNEKEHRALGDIQALEQLYILLCKDCSNKLEKEEDFMFKNPNEIIQRCFLGP